MQIGLGVGLTAASASARKIFNKWARGNYSQVFTDTTIAGSSSLGTCSGSIAVTSGKWYYETKILITPTASNNGLGVCGALSFGDSYAGETGVAYTSGVTPTGGVIYRAGLQVLQLATNFVINDIIGVAFDADARTVAFYKNNVLIWSGTIPFAGAIYSHGKADTNNAGAPQLQTNWGGTVMVYAPPAGYNAGIYTYG